MQTLGNAWWKYILRWAKLPYFWPTLICFVLGTAYFLSPVYMEREILAPYNDEARVGFGSTRTVAQEFISPHKLQAIVIPIEREPNIDGPLILHVRTELKGPDLITSTLFSFTGGQARFDFSKMLNGGTKYVWILEAPNNFDKTSWVYLEHDETAYNHGNSYIKDTQLTGNFGFTLIQRKYRGAHLFEQLLAVTPFWEWRSAIVGTVVASLVATYYSALRKPHHRVSWLLILILATFVIHIFLAQRLPAVTDEGAYLQDAQQAQLTFLPFRDYLTKGPLFIGLLASWQKLFGYDLFTGRLLSAFIWALAVYLTAIFGRIIDLKGWYYIAAFAMSVLPAAVSLTTPMLLQSMSTVVVLAGLILVLRGVKGDHLGMLIFGALLLAGGYLVRSSSLVLVITGTIAIILYGRHRIKALITYLATYFLLLLIIFAISVNAIGIERTAIMFNLEAFIISGQRSSTASETREPIIRQLTSDTRTLWRSAPWFMAALVMVPPIILRKLGKKLRIVGLVVWLIVLINVFLHLRDMQFLLPKSFPVTTASMVIIVFGLPILWTLFSFQGKNPNRPKPEKTIQVKSWFTKLSFDLKLVQNWRALLLLVAWLVLLTGLYYFWQNFRQNYLIEFLPPLALLSAWVSAQVAEIFQSLTFHRTKRFITAGLCGLLAMSIYQGYWLAASYPHTGTIDITSLQAVSTLVRKHVEPGQAVFTAQPLITAEAYRPIVLGYSHPGWYLSERVGEVSSSLRSIYFMEPLALTSYLETTVQFVLTDDRTQEVYFDQYPERQEILKNNFLLLGELSDGRTEEPMRLYKKM